MKTLHYYIQINAPVSRVYETMLDAEGFKRWTAIFQPTSRFDGSWDKGSTIRFLADDEHGVTCGMVSYIRENIPNELVSIEHKGHIQDGKEITTGKDVEAFAGGLEEYTFQDTDHGTQLQVRTDTLPEWINYFEETWPKALKKLKEMCES